MTTETQWMPAVIVMSVGLVIGIALAIWAYRRSKRSKLGASTKGSGGEATTSTAPDSTGGAEAEQLQLRMADLERRKEQLLTQLRELADSSKTQPAQSIAEERHALETDAAQVMREISELQTQISQVTPAEASMPVATPHGSHLKGLVTGVAVTVFAVGVGFALWQGATPRGEGMAITGNTSLPSAPPAQVSGQGAGGQAGAAARPLVAKQTPRLEKARAAVKQDPSSLPALVELGYALIEAGGWIEAFQTAGVILQQDTTNADGRIQMALVRSAMKQFDEATRLLDDVLEQEPDNVRALEVRGRIALHIGSRDEAIALWQRGMKNTDAKQMFSELIASAKAMPDTAIKPPPAPAHPPMGAANATRPGDVRHPPIDNAPGVPPGHPPVASASAPPPTGSDSTPPTGAAQLKKAGATPQDKIAGTISIAPGTQAPPRGVLYVMARPAGVTAGPPVAVKRLMPTAFPLSFSIGAGDAMMGGTLPNEVSLSVRLDSDGDVMTKQAGDLVGQPQGTVKLGEQVNIVLQSGAPNAS